jgi:hypothetical protein
VSSQGVRKTRTRLDWRNIAAGGPWTLPAMSFTVVNDPRHWLGRARHMRELADQTSDDDARLAMLRIALEYERLAERAAARAEGRALAPMPRR